MAKKTAIVSEAATPAAPKSTKKVLPTIPCALQYYWQFALLAWRRCLANVVAFAGERPYFTEEYIDGEITYINSTKELPNNRTRVSMSKELRMALQARRQAVLDEAVRLGLAIDYAYREEPKEVATVQREQAGIAVFSTASPRNWGAVSSFITTAKNYLTANGATLLEAGAINEGFVANFTTVGKDFNQLWDDVVDERQAAKDGTAAVANGIKRIKRELDPMLKLGSETIFKYDPDKRQLFTVESLVDEVRGGHPAGVKGRTNWATTEKPIAGLLVEVLDEEGKSAVTDAKGRYEIRPLAAGEYTLRFSSDTTVPFEQKITVTAGVVHRLNVLLEPAPISAKSPSTAPAPAATNSMASMLSESLKEVGETNGTAV